MLALTVSCTEKESSDENMGYLRIGVETNTVLKTKAGVTNAPSSYSPRQINLKVISSAGNIVLYTEDFEHDTALKGQVSVLPVDRYTIVAQSNGWDGTGSGVDAPFYYGETTVDVKKKTVTTANVTLTQSNVKVTVNFSDSFKENFSAATATIGSAVSGVAPITYTMGTPKAPSYFPVADLSAVLQVTNHQGESHTMTTPIEGVSARDHYILNYTIAAAGAIEGVTVNVDPQSNTYTYTFSVPRKSKTSLVAYPANAWSTFAYLDAAVTGKQADFDATKIALQYKSSGASSWTTVANADLTISGENISYTLKNLSPSTSYSYRITYITDAEEVTSAESTFTTEAQPALYNGGFELWHQGDRDASGTSHDAAWYPTESEGYLYWDTSNAGSTVMGANWNGTTKDTSFKHGGTASAKLQSQNVVIKFAAASLYTGQFDHLDGTKGAILNWGTPFTGRPTNFHGFLNYKTSGVNRDNHIKDFPVPSEAPAKGQPDQFALYWALTTARIQVDNTKITTTFPDWNTDPRIIAYGAYPVEKCVSSSDGEWVEFNIPLKYYSLTTKPSYLVIVASASRYGDYFYGSDSSCLHLDDFELIYGDEPVSR